MSAVELSGVTKRFRSTVALDDVSLAFEPGVTGLLGPNGAGKTTLLRLVATSIAPDRGTVRVLGHDPLGGHRELTAIRRRLGYLPQELGYPSDMTTFGFLEYMAVLKEWDDRSVRHEEVRRVIDLVGLTEHSTRKIPRLSGGQRHRVGLAQALLGDPAVLVLDEPTTGVDPEQRAALRAVLSRLGRRAAVLISTHQTEDVAALCERVVVLTSGSVRFDGSVPDLVATAAGQVWLCDGRADEVTTGVAQWRTGTGRQRVVGGPCPPGGESAEPTLEDAYLLMRGRDETNGRQPVG
jgi:ABC-2 type transport system ATP-binding protein